MCMVVPFYGAFLKICHTAVSSTRAYSASFLVGFQDLPEAKSRGEPLLVTTLPQSLLQIPAM